MALCSMKKRLGFLRRTKTHATCAANRSSRVLRRVAMCGVGSHVAFYSSTASVKFNNRRAYVALFHFNKVYLG
jgi:hypothetical protein